MRWYLPFCCAYSGRYEVVRLNLPAYIKVDCLCRQKRRLQRRQQKPKLQHLLHLLLQLLQQLLHHLSVSLYLLPSLTQLLLQLRQHLLQLQANPPRLQGFHRLLPKQTTGAPLLHPQGSRVTLPHLLPPGSCRQGSRFREGLSALGRRLLHPFGEHSKVTDQVCMFRRRRDLT